MRKGFLIASGLVLASVVGCVNKPETPDQLQQRYVSASAITDEGTHDQQMMKIAADAANSNNPSMCLTAVGDIKNAGSRDTTAKDCAGTFNNMGDRNTTNMLVDKVTNPELKDQLNKMYSNQPAPTPGMGH